MGSNAISGTVPCSDGTHQRTGSILNQARKGRSKWNAPENWAGAFYFVILSFRNFRLTCEETDDCSALPPAFSLHMVIFHRECRERFTRARSTLSSSSQFELRSSLGSWT
jgi:hypothetical protein